MENDIDERFEEFHSKNPQVYAELVRLARIARAGKHGRIGIRMLWEVMRWNLLYQTQDQSSSYKFNDHYHSRYARLIQNNEPDLRGVFELRRLRS